MNAVREPADQRRRELAKIHIRATELGLIETYIDEDGKRQENRQEYDKVLWTVGRVKSARELDAAGRKRLLDQLYGRGRRHNYPGRPKFTTREAQIEKIEALLADAGRPWTYAIAMAKRMYRKDRLEFCNRKELQGIIAALTYDQRKRARQQAMQRV